MSSYKMEEKELDTKRMLNINEFAHYSGLGICKARKLARESGAEFKFGGRLLIDKKRFDEWCDKR